MNSENCCTCGSRMIWAHSQDYPDWGIYYDDSSGEDKMHWRQEAGLEIMTVDFMNSRVGIGTTEPNDKLEINAGYVGGGLRASWGSSYPNLYGEFKHEGSGGLVINANANGGWADMSFQTDGTTRMFIESGGNVGSGTETPSSLFNVEGGGSYFRTWQDVGDPASVLCDRTNLGYSFSGAQLGSEDYGVEGWHYGTGYAGYFIGDVHVYGTPTKNSGSFVQPHAGNPEKEIMYAFFEGPENAVFLRGTAQLKDGKALIELPEHFRIVAAEEGVQVQVTPLEDCNGMFVGRKSRERIEVQELMSGKHDAKFDYFVTAVRAGFEEYQPVVDNTHFKPKSDETAQEFERRFSKDDITTRAMRQMLISNGILTEDGKLDMVKVEELGWTIAKENPSPDGERMAELR